MKLIRWLMFWKQEPKWWERRVWLEGHAPLSNVIEFKKVA